MPPRDVTLFSVAVISSAKSVLNFPKISSALNFSANLATSFGLSRDFSLSLSKASFSVTQKTRSSLDANWGKMKKLAEAGAGYFCLVLILVGLAAGAKLNGIRDENDEPR